MNNNHSHAQIKNFFFIESHYVMILYINIFFVSQNEYKPPLYLVARNHASLAGPEAFKDMPKSIEISGQHYQLGMITMYDNSRQHFTSLHYVNKEFVYYDGLMSSKKNSEDLYQKTTRKKTSWWTMHYMSEL